MISGVVGLIRWRYYTAAAINGYGVAPLRGRPGEWELVATVVQSDAYKMAQQPLMFVAKHARGEWVWPILELEHVEVNGIPQVRARLGRLERSVSDVAVRPR